MTANEFFTMIAQISGLLGIVCSMLAMGLGLTVAQIIQPLKNARLVILALLANFVLVPLLAYVITLIIPLEESLKIGLIVLSYLCRRALPDPGGARRKSQPGRCRRADDPADGRDHLLPAAGPAAAPERR